METWRIDVLMVCSVTAKAYSLVCPSTFASALISPTSACSYWQPIRSSTSKTAYTAMRREQLTFLFRLSTFFSFPPETGLSSISQVESYWSHPTAFRRKDRLLLLH